jgi:hypothetical protein
MAHRPGDVRDLILSRGDLILGRDDVILSRGDLIHKEPRPRGSGTVG